MGIQSLDKKEIKHKNMLYVHKKVCVVYQC